MQQQNLQLTRICLSFLRGRVPFLEIVFVGQCEVFVCLDISNCFFVFFLSAEALNRSANWVSIL